MLANYKHLLRFTLKYVKIYFNVFDNVIVSEEVSDKTPFENSAPRQITIIDLLRIKENQVGLIFFWEFQLS